MYSFQNSNEAFIGMCKIILEEGVWRETRGLRCLEIPNPVMFCITNPVDRYINIEERKWNKYLPFAESLWLALGLNDLDVLPGHYVKNLYNYSDDGRTWRAGYGPRIRSFNGLGIDYDISSVQNRYYAVWDQPIVVDQLKYVILKLKEDLNTRQAVITLSDPAKDCFNLDGGLKATRDQPCSRSVQFMVVNGKLDCTLYIRSNDVLFGMSGVNIFNFTWMQEYIACMLQVPVGNYYHVANNLHLYEDKYDDIVKISNTIYVDSSDFYDWQYRRPIESLAKFDYLLERLQLYELEVRQGTHINQLTTGYEMFDDWAKVFLHHKIGNEADRFHNPYLNRLFYGTN